MTLKEFIEEFIPDSRTFIRLIHVVEKECVDVELDSTRCAVIKKRKEYERIPLRIVNGEVKTMATAELIMFDDYYKRYHDCVVRGLIDSCSPIEEVDTNAVNIIIDDE